VVFGRGQAVRRRLPGAIMESVVRRYSCSDDLVVEPLCWQCYDYAASVLFTWHAPSWRRFIIALRAGYGSCADGEDLGVWGVVREGGGDATPGKRISMR
jgi:hypothetical protein